MSNIIQVFIENPAGSRTKNIHDEKTLEFKGSIPVAQAYPFPYGFILDTTSEDGGNLDCFVLTNHSLHRGDVVACSVVGLMEQYEDGKPDHNILATPVGESVALTESVKSELKVFVTEVFSVLGEDMDVRLSGGEVMDYLDEVAQRLKSKNITAGEFLDVAPALSLIKQCSDK
ncbi:inorganic diphosphatase [Chloroflexota bacterium]